MSENRPRTNSRSIKTALRTESGETRRNIGLIEMILCRKGGRTRIQCMKRSTYHSVDHPKSRQSIHPFIHFCWYSLFIVYIVLDVVVCVGCAGVTIISYVSHCCVLVWCIIRLYGWMQSVSPFPPFLVRNLGWRIAPIPLPFVCRISCRYSSFCSSCRRSLLLHYRALFFLAIWSISRQLVNTRATFKRLLTIKTERNIATRLSAMQKWKTILRFVFSRKRWVCVEMKRTHVEGDNTFVEYIFFPVQSTWNSTRSIHTTMAGNNVLVQIPRNTCGGGGTDEQEEGQKYITLIYEPFQE